MADIYVRSTDGNNADSGATWALAKATITGAAAIDNVGDTIWLSQSHHETSSGASLQPVFAGTVAAPTRLLCGNDAAEPPTQLATGAVVELNGTGFYQILLTAASLYCYGVEFRAGNSTNFSGLNFGAATRVHVYENCKFTFGTTYEGLSVSFNMVCRLINPIFKFAHATHKIALDGVFEIVGGSFDPTTVSPNYVFNYGSKAPILLVKGFDFSNLSTTVNLVGNFNSLQAKFIECKLPTAWTGGLVGNAPDVNGRIEMYDCEASDAVYRLWIEDTFGVIRDEVSIYRTGGANDGTTSLSWKMTSNSNANWLAGRLLSPEIMLWNSVTGVSRTCAIEVIHDSATALDNDEIWVEALFQDTGGVGTWVEDTISDALASPAAQASSSVDWTGTGSMSNPNKQKLEITFTPQQIGYLVLRVVLAKAGPYTVYVDPKVAIS